MEKRKEVRKKWRPDPLTFFSLLFCAVVLYFGLDLKLDSSAQINELIDIIDHESSKTFIIVNGPEKIEGTSLRGIVVKSNNPGTPFVVFVDDLFRGQPGQSLRLKSVKTNNSVFFIPDHAE